MLDQRVVHEVARRGILERQLPLLRTHYREKRDVMVAALRSELGRRARAGDDPRGGFFLWADAAAKPSMPIACSIERSRHGVVYVAGEAFFVEPERPDVATDRQRT